MRKVVILDTSVLCVWLKIPHFDSCGSDSDKWNKERVDKKIEEEKRAKSTLVLPLATLIETGNHIAKAATHREEKAKALSEIMREIADERTPWAAFSDQSELWTPEKIKTLANSWPHEAAQKLSLADATIKNIAEFYSQTGYCVEILTGDKGLKAYEPTTPLEIPRRRQR